MRADLAIVGAGAAGLFAAIWAGRTAPGARIVALDGARRVGAKILVAGGGRCNVTHFEVSERDYAGSTPASIRRVLARFGVERTVDFFRDLGVQLKREETGKLFPVTDDAHTVLHALLEEVQRVGVELRHPARVRAIRTLQSAGADRPDGFTIDFDGGSIDATRVILATGGRALPKSGSDGFGFELAGSLGHTTTRPITAALVPLLLHETHWARTISGVATEVEVIVRAGAEGADGRPGPVTARARGNVLCTHFGLSGPAILDASRHLLQQPGSTLGVRWIPDVPDDRLDAWLLEGAGHSLLTRLREVLPDRLARIVLATVGIDASLSPRQLSREARARLVRELAAPPLPVTGDRGDSFAEATAGGVPLREVRLETLESRVTPGLHLCGEILDVDGRIGGFNFQWAWASGFVAGSAALASKSPPSNILHPPAR